MLRIEKATANELIVTATEKVTIDNPYFLLHFKHQATNKEVAMIVADTSMHPLHYNTFTFTEGTDLDLESGMHVYRIYAQTSSNNLDPTLADEEVERGLAWAYTNVADSTPEYSMDSTVKAYTWN